MAKVDIFSGFLGAGKTTLIKKLIAEGYDTKNIVLIENEFGEIGVDTGFLRESGVKINEMVAGCICCTLVGDFGKALNEVIEQYDPDRILIEPSGVGKLSDVIIAVQDLQNDKIELNGFTTVVDAKRYKMYMENFGEFFANQVEHASSIFLSHQQSMTSAELDEVVKDIRTLNKTAQVVTTDWDQLSGAKMLEVMESDKTLNAELDKLREEAYEELEAHEHEHEHDHDHDHEHHHHHHHHDDDEHEHCEHHHDHDHDEHDHEHHHHDHDHECGCGHHHHHHHHHHGHDADEVFDEVGAQTSNKYTRAELEDIIDSLDECGEVIRAKGIVENADGGWLEFDYVPGEGEVRETGAEATGMVAVIGTRLNKEKLHELFKLS
ncbi:MAG: GTP-binding protein [Mogibacterium sp.]|nr:GTP-binding protein [Mogibacterium sp.]